MKSTAQARPTSTPKSVGKSNAFMPKGLATSRCTPASKTAAKLYNKPSECC